MTMNFQRNIEILCHGEQPPHVVMPVAWETVRQQPFRTCNYCGSIHPLDLLVYLIQRRADLQGADWKYGWPHKFYCKLLNPRAVGQEYKGKGPQPFLSTKFYNLHFLDLNEEEFDALADGLYYETDILFERDGRGKITYLAPAPGYQAEGRQSELYHEVFNSGLFPPEVANQKAAARLREEMMRKAN